MASRWLTAVAEAYVAVAVVAVPFLGAAFTIPSGSMTPTLRRGDRVLTTPITYRFRPPRVGEIVVFAAPEPFEVPGRRHIKRVVGVGGDLLSICRPSGESRAVLRRNGDPVPEAFLHEAMAYELPADATPAGLFTLEEGQIRVPPGTVFVLGDNRNASTDSHVFGCVAVERVTDRAVAVVWPPSHARILDPPQGGAAECPP
jgi:signal peptidase I